MQHLLDHRTHNIQFVALSCLLFVCLYGTMTAQSEKSPRQEGFTQGEEQVSNADLLVAKVFFDRGDWEKAAAFYEFARAAKVMSVDDYHDLAYAYMQTKHYARARQILDAILTIYPDDQLAWKNISLVYYRMDCQAAALKCAERAVALDSTDMNSWMLLGVMAVENGDYDRAWVVFDRFYPIDIEKATILHEWIVEETEAKNFSREEW